jgi:hypothetical protein
MDALCTRYTATASLISCEVLLIILLASSKKPIMIEKNEKWSYEQATWKTLSTHGNISMP